MHSGEHWNGVTCDVHTSKDLSRLRDSGETGGKGFRRKMTQLKMNMVLVRTTASRGVEERREGGGRRRRSRKKRAGRDRGRETRNKQKGKGKKGRKGKGREEGRDG